MKNTYLCVMNKKWLYPLILLLVVLIAGIVYIFVKQHPEQSSDTAHPTSQSSQFGRKWDSFTPATAPQLTVAVMPVMDCLPVAVAYFHNFFERQGVRVNLLSLNAQMDCDTAFTGGSAQIAYSDRVRAERMKGRGVALDYLTTADGTWKLIANKGARLTDISQLGDKMVAMTRYSATDMLTTQMLQKAKTKNTVFRVQVNDVHVRLKMILTGAMDAAWLPEPQATAAIARGHKVLPVQIDQTESSPVFVYNPNNSGSTKHQQYINAFVKAYDEAVDSINKYGINHYAEECRQLTKIEADIQRKIPTYTFHHARRP